MLAAHRILSAPVVAANNGGEAEAEAGAGGGDKAPEVSGFIDIRDLLSSFLQGGQAGRQAGRKIGGLGGGWVGGCLGGRVSGRPARVPNHLPAVFPPRLTLLALLPLHPCAPIINHPQRLT